MKPGMQLVAKSKTRAELHIEGFIGEYGVTARRLREQLANQKDISDIDVYLNSGGGSVIEGLNIFNMLKRHQANITVYIGGLAASMGSVIAMAADLVVIPANALIMVHNPWGFAMGEAKDMRKVADILDKMRDSLASIYVARSGTTTEEIQALMDAETWMTGEEAVEAGFADVVEGEVEADNVIDIETARAQVQDRKNPMQAELKTLVACGRGDLPIEMQTDAEGFYAMAAPGLRLNRQEEPGSTAILDGVDIDFEEMHNTPLWQSLVASIQPATPTQPTEANAATETTTEEEDAMTPEEMKAALEKRNAEIKKLFAKHTQLNALQMDCMADVNLTLDEVKDKLLAELGKNTHPSSGVTEIESNIDKAKTGMQKALLARAGHETDDEANEYRGFTLLEMARASLRLRNVAPVGDKMAVIGLAFTHSTSDFGTLLSNTANKSMLKGFMEAEETFPQFCGTGTLPDFKVNERVDIGHAPSLREVRAGAEYKHITMSDRGATAQLATYGELFGINRQAIINDDLGAFTRVPAKMGRAARRTVGDLVFSVLTAGDNFSADNQVTSSALASATFDALRVKMATQKDGEITTPVRPSYLLTPVALEGTAKQVMEAEFMIEAAKNSRQPNTVRGAAEVISDYRLDAISATTWYALASAIAYDALDVLYLDGNPNPFLEQQAGWNIDGTEFKVRIDAAAKLWDARSVGRGQA